MKTILPLLAICCVCFFSSCTEELNTSTRTIELTPEAYLLRLDQTVVFQYVQFDENENWKSGWLIDFEGNIHQYAIDHSVSERDGSISCLEVSDPDMLQYSTGIVGEVEIATLVDYHKKLNRIKKAGHTMVQLENPTNSAYYGINQKKTWHEPQADGSANGCGSGSNSYINESWQEEYILLEKFAANSIVSAADEAQEIISWMQDLDKEL